MGVLRVMPTKAFSDAVGVVTTQRGLAIYQHGPLKPGADRWLRLLAEEWQEVEDELHILNIRAQFSPSMVSEARRRTIAELAQLAQLAIGVIELLQAEEAQCHKEN